jgi:hypothetical protein
MRLDKETKLNTTKICARKHKKKQALRNYMKESIMIKDDHTLDDAGVYHFNKHQLKSISYGESNDDEFGN